MSKVDDTKENVEICKKNCGTCPTHKANNLSDASPGVLFCARGKSDKEEITDEGCNCPQCAVFKEYNLSGGWFCIYGVEGKS